MHSSTTDNNAITTNDANNDVAPITRGDGNDAKEEELEEEAASNNNNEQYIPPWSLPQLKAPSSSRYSRFRQHVNPLARRYQMATELPENWPHSDFDNVNLPLYLDIGCGKGGFLLELVGRRHGSFVGIRDDTYMNNTKTLMEDATSDWLPSTMNYLGLEIRPGVSQYSQARVEKRGLGGILSFVGCNANVDLDRLLTLYQEESAATTADADADNNHRVAFVSIQFPDPHFKKAHSKRRVVTPELVTTLAKFMKEGDVVFLQSDIKDALEAMRERFVEDDGKIYFDEWSPDPNEGHQQEYGMGNPLGIPTEREVSVLKKGLPVYRTLFKRNGVGF
ncbi:hypothetical protein ACHAXR_005146 [Thalassiosira sp. AJA248-18]